jgi:two-component system, cell cycle sensor histidine kinase and response regulator CckA
MGKGTGLGLSIVYGIVKQSGGYIWVYSEPGLGTTFKLYFPVTDSEVASGPQRTDVAERPNGETILVVEDDAAIRTNVRDCLRQLGYTALEAASGYKALELCEQLQGKIDLVLTDLVMPGMSGHQMGHKLARRYPGIQMLYTSGYTEEVAARRDLLQAATLFLEKPYTVADLARAIQRGLSARRELTVSPAPFETSPTAGSLGTS